MPHGCRTPCGGNSSATTRRPSGLPRPGSHPHKERASVVRPDSAGTESSRRQRRSDLAQLRPAESVGEAWEPEDGWPSAAWRDMDGPARRRRVGLILAAVTAVVLAAGAPVPAAHRIGRLRQCTRRQHFAAVEGRTARWSAHLDRPALHARSRGHAPTDAQNRVRHPVALHSTYGHGLNIRLICCTCVQSATTEPPARSSETRPCGCSPRAGRRW